MTAPEVLIVGLDSMPPAIAFDTCAAIMPNLTRLRADGASGPLRSTDPPVTCPAWISMTTGRPPGELGIYGFRRRQTGTYAMSLVSAADITHPRIWDLADAAQKRSVVVSVPLTWPPVAGPRTALTSCFLTPSDRAAFTAGCADATELRTLFGPYIPDVEDFRGADVHATIDRCAALTKQHGAIFRHLIARHRPHFAMMVDLGPDRFHHACLRHVMATHPDFAPDHRALDYYRLLDNELGATLALAGPDTTVMVVSDHGVKPLYGAVCINELLLREGLLVLRDGPPPVPAPLSALNVNWDRTVAFGEGGYHGRIFLNRTGRDPGGIVTPDRAPALIDQLRRLLTALTGPDGHPMHNVVFEPSEKYGDTYAGMPPDLTVYFDNLNRRSAGTVGHGTIFLPCNDTGTDHANHDFDGIFALLGPGVQRGERRASILDIFATALHRLGIAAPAGTSGQVL